MKVRYRSIKGRTLEAKQAFNLPPSNYDLEDSETRRALIKLAVADKTPPAMGRLPDSLARAMAGVSGLKRALEIAFEVTMSEKHGSVALQQNGWDEANDLLTALSEGLYHPALIEWEKSPLRAEKRLISPSQMQIRMEIIAICRELGEKNDHYSRRKIGIMEARSRVAKALKGVPGFEEIDGQQIINWEANIPRVLNKRTGKGDKWHKDRLKERIEDVRKHLQLSALDEKNLLSLVRDRAILILP